jgi:hypothetical protein
VQAPISSSANWRYTCDLSTQVHLTSGSTYPILARLAHGPTHDSQQRLPPVSDAARRIQAGRAERDGGFRVRTPVSRCTRSRRSPRSCSSPWTVRIATQLPHLAVAHHWNTAWAGLDVAIAIGLALTSWLAHRRDARAALTATATLMCADGWFDLCTSAPGHPFAYAAAEAAAELMVAAVCLVTGLHTQQDADGRPSDDLRLPAGPAVARRDVPLSAPGQGPM